MVGFMPYIEVSEGYVLRGGWALRKLSLNLWEEDVADFEISADSMPEILQMWAARR